MRWDTGSILRCEVRCSSVRSAALVRWGTVRIYSSISPHGYATQWLRQMVRNGLIRINHIASVMELSGVVMVQVAARATVGDITTIGYGIGYWGILDAAVSS